MMILGAHEHPIVATVNCSENGNTCVLEKYHTRLLSADTQSRINQYITELYTELYSTAKLRVLSEQVSE